MKFISKIIYFYRRKIQLGFKIGRDELVVDIGSGDKPFWRADIFFDNLSLGNEQRISTTETITDLGAFIDGNLPNTPFKDKTFNFSFCSHLLEHVDDPDKAIKEIMRISKRGYIEVPDGILETINPFRSHLWFIFLNGNKLVFVRKSKKMHETLINNGLSFSYLFKKIKNPFIRLYWDGAIEYEIMDDLKDEDKFTAIQKDESLPNKNDPYKFIVKIMRKIFYKEKDLNALLK